MVGKKGEVSLTILAVIGLVALIVGAGAFLLWSNGQPQDVIVNQETSLQEMTRGIESEAIVFQDVTLYDSTVYDPTTNTCTAQRYGMNITIRPCVAQNPVGRNIQQYVDFNWLGVSPQNTSWVFVYDGQLQSGNMELLQNITQNRTVIVDQWISNYLVDRVVNFTDLGTPVSGSCKLGNTHNTHMYSVNRWQGIPTNYTNTIYCFTDSTVVNATAFRISGNIDVQQVQTFQAPAWVDITSSVQYMGYGLLSDNRSYYQVQNVQFQPGQTYQTRWTYTGAESQKRGKWHILGYDPQVGLVQSILNDQYIYIDPWWNNNWGLKKQINITNTLIDSNLTNYPLAVYFNSTNFNFNQAKTDGSDLRFVNISETGELNYEIEYWDSTLQRGLVWVKVPIIAGNQSSAATVNALNYFFVYYNNPSATDGQTRNQVFDSNFGVVIHYSRLNSTNTSWFDSSTYAINASTIPGAVQSVVPPTQFLGYTGNYTDGNRVLEVPDHNAIDATTELTTSAWFNISTQGGGNFSRILSKGDGGNYQDNWFNPLVIRTMWGDTGSNAFSLNQWFLETTTFNNGVAKVYVNGELIATFSGQTSPLTANSDSLGIGGLVGATSRTQNGFMDEARMSNVERNATWIKADYLSQTNQMLVFGGELTNNAVTSLLISPANNSQISITNVTFIVNSSATGTTQFSNVTLFVWNATSSAVVFQNTTTLSGNATTTTNWTRNFSDGNYLWNALTKGDDGTSGFATANFSFRIDTSPPSVNLSTNISDQFVESFPANITLNYTASDPALSQCFYYTSDNATIVFVTCNVSTGYPVAFNSGGFKTIFFAANDTAGTTTTRNTTFEIGTYSTSQNLNSIAEGGQAIFTMQLNKTGIGSQFQNANLTYKSVNRGFTDISIADADHVTISNSFVVPVGTGSPSGTQVYWNWTFGTNMSSIITTNTKSQTVFSPGLSDCSAGGTVILNFTHMSETNRTLINYTNGNNLQVDLTLKSLVDNSVAFMYNTTKVNSPTLAVCVGNEVLNNTSYRLDLTGSYVATNYVQEFFYIDNGTITLATSPQRYNWFDLPIDDSTTFLFNFLDETGLEVPGSIVETLRYYIGDADFTEVERSKQDNNGETHIHLIEEDVIYKFNITLNNQQIFLSEQYNAKCLSTPCSITLSAEPDNPDFTTTYNNLPEGSYTVTANKTSRQVTLTFNLNQTATMNLSIWTQNNNEAELIVQGVTTASSGNVIVTVPYQYGNATYSAVIYKDDDFVGTRVISLNEDAQDYFGALGLFLGALAVLCLALIGASHGEWVIVWTILGLITVSTLYLVDLPWYALLTFVAGAGIFLIKLIGRRRVQ